MKIIEQLKEIYARQQFDPGIIGVFIHPFYFSRRGLHQNISQFIKELEGSVLDIGCGTKPYEYLCPCDKYIGLDMDGRDNKKADIYYDGTKMPFENGSFDGLISSQVFEHVFNPHDFLREANRILKKDGLFLLSVPLIWAEHEKPFDYGRYTIFGLTDILEKNGFDVVRYNKTNKGIRTICQLIDLYIYEWIFTKSEYVNLFISLFTVAPVNIMGIVLDAILPENENLYLDIVILAKKKRDI
jgi:SAM-dependent methyltransferase